MGEQSSASFRELTLAGGPGKASAFPPWSLERMDQRLVFGDMAHLLVET